MHRERGVAIHGGGRGQDDPCGLAFEGCLQHPLRGLDIGARVINEVLAPARPNTGPASQVEDDVAGAQHLVESELIEVGRQEVEARMRTGPSDVRPFENRRIRRGERVDPDHLMALLKQRLHEVRADEAGRAGYDRSI